MVALFEFEQDEKIIFGQGTFGFHSSLHLMGLHSNYLENQVKDG
jgi:hypothetical protein